MSENEKYNCASVKKDDGGVAFPDQLSRGMSLRDYFASQALTAIISYGSTTFYGSKGVLNKSGELASVAYHLADAMLIERNK